MALKTTVITGATSGIGQETALALAAQGHALYLLVRNIPKGERLKNQIIGKTGNKEIYVLRCDLADLQSVREAADELTEKLFAINTLINNAGGVFEERQLSKNGFEMTLATNHLGHFLLTHCLMPLLQKGQARIINVSSKAHKWSRPRFDDLQWEQFYSAFKAYGMSKLFNIYFTQSLAEKYGEKGILAFSAHPGLVKTGFGATVKGLNKMMMLLARPFMITAEQGAETIIFLATAAKLEKYNGAYFIKNKVAKTSVIATDTESRNKLWVISEKLLSRYLIWPVINAG
ncbi:NAD(P)-dependent dehydrogenase, short-chain alcohol dehydrogenase family [Mucilaginibacter lappiensis]|uniref:NAD(P)-dependent dehydrogenase (Short-subunit alcohol dehydrogenase family) n=1 Tax=Mucilaginibacter lappiensis TaxID=354630 RepID=A0ABR6PGD6_9SPHI|nr:SDR family oxidoreductase [Mucilaginibacter lappiensis]MBB6108830.1 NAD(P)-dependent dehydrogenase (short-subunit alcohol dehydrogenase family) [Mucilaginibacter lappiensis]SIQ63978.1 NAD(P)-dependent dehydrogenase, short-chain alcohol dehydrogenase family [Mucilaginibacter lappiensis]